jgi:hypothetical protein
MQTQALPAPTSLHMYYILVFCSSTAYKGRSDRDQVKQLGPTP